MTFFEVDFFEVTWCAVNIALSFRKKKKRMLTTNQKTMMNRCLIFCVQTNRQTVR